MLFIACCDILLDLVASRTFAQYLMIHWHDKDSNIIGFSFDHAFNVLRHFVFRFCRRMLPREALVIPWVPTTVQIYRVHPVLPGTMEAHPTSRETAEEDFEEFKFYILPPVCRRKGWVSSAIEKRRNEKKNTIATFLKSHLMYTYIF